MTTTVKSNFQTLVTEAYAEVNKTYERSPWKIVFGDIKALLNELNGTGRFGRQFQDYNSDELSRIGGNLAVWQALLSEGIREVNREVSASEIFLKYRKAGLRDGILKHLESKYDRKITVTDINIEMDRQLAKDYMIKELHETEVEHLKNFYFSINNILHRIEQRIKIMESGRATTKFEDNAYGEIEMEPQPKKANPTDKNLDLDEAFTT